MLKSLILALLLTVSVQATPLPPPKIVQGKLNGISFVGGDFAVYVDNQRYLLWNHAYINYKFGCYGTDEPHTLFDHVSNCCSSFKEMDVKLIVQCGRVEAVIVNSITYYSDDED